MRFGSAVAAGLGDRPEESSGDGGEHLRLRFGLGGFRSGSLGSGAPLEFLHVLRLELDPPLRELGQVDLDLEGLVGQVGGELGKVLVGHGLPFLGQDLVLQELVRGVVLDVREIAVPERGDDVVVAAGLLGDLLDQLQEIEKLLAVEAAIEIEDLRPVLEKEEGQALDGRLVGVDDLAGAGEGVFLDAHFEPRVGLEEVVELPVQGVDEVLHRGVVGTEELHGRDGVGHAHEDVFGLPDDLLVGEDEIVRLMPVRREGRAHGSHILLRPSAPEQV